MPRILHASDLHLSESEREYSLAVFAELESRFRDGKAYYPFSVAGRLLSRQQHRDPRYFPSLFCLCMSYFEHGKNATANGIDPRLLFEEVACLALEGYSGATARVFGTGRTKGMSGFKAAVKGLLGSIMLSLSIQDIPQ